MCWGCPTNNDDNPTLKILFFSHLCAPHYAHAQLTELRAALNVLGLSLQGNKYDMVERLLAHNTVSDDSIGH